MSINIYNICKWYGGSRWGGGGGGLYKHLTKIDHFARWSFLLYINCINIIYSIVIGHWFT